MEEKLETKSEITIKRKASPYWICFSIVITILIFITIGILAYLFHSGYFDNIIKQLQPQVNNQYTIPERNSTVNNYINISINRNFFHHLRHALGPFSASVVVVKADVDLPTFSYLFYPFILECHRSMRRGDCRNPLRYKKQSVQLTLADDDGNVRFC